jgi:pimeloyl-ACP methyl ester carboxylesterase
MNVTTIVLIPGLFMTALCWEHWVKYYSSKGYCVVARSWPGMEGEIERLRRDPSSLASLGLTDVVDHYERIIRELDTPPIIIGHGLGGLVTQILLDRGWGAAGVAIALAPPKGVRRFSFATLKAAFSALANSFDNRKARSLTPHQFHVAFASTLCEAASIAAFERYVVPASNRLLRQLAFANVMSGIRFHNDSRAPLLLIAGGKDRIVPTSVVKANFDSYRESKAETDYKEYPNQSHFTLLQETKVADYVLGWAICRADSASTLAGFPNRKASWSVQLSA